MPQVPVQEEPDSSTIKETPVRNAFGGQVIGSMARLRRLTSGKGSPLKSIKSKDELARMRGRPSHVRHPVQKRATSSTTIRAAASVKLLDNGSRTARMRVMERSFREFHKGFVV